MGACRFLSRAVLAVSAYCLQHLTLEREASRSGVKFTGPQERDVVLCAEKDATQHNCHQCIAICVISSLTSWQEFR